MERTDSQHDVILFDGVCNLCNGFVQFVIARDPRKHFRFGALDSDAARRLMAQAGVIPGSHDSIILIESGRAFVRSQAALRVVRALGLPWSLFYVLIVVPRPVRDWTYDVIARHRYRWFGRRDVCMVPGPETRGRFLD
jgi:predicted DCC family thiol-disulfide oxidoreductase YuxK